MLSVDTADMGEASPGTPSLRKAIAGSWRNGLPPNIEMTFAAPGNDPSNDEASSPLPRRRRLEGEAEVFHHGLGPIVDGTLGESGALAHPVHWAEVGGDESKELIIHSASSGRTG
jgi:hypothetical protein